MRAPFLSRLLFPAMVFLAGTSVAAQEPVCDSGPANTDNGQFSIELVSVEREGSIVTFTYEVCKIGPRGTRDLSHWSLDLTEIEQCLAAGNTLADLVVAAEPAGAVTITDSRRDDPTTGLVGIKWDIGFDGPCGTYFVSFDESKLEAGCSIALGNVAVATKAGPQDIRRPQDRDKPGYAIVCGPICDCQAEHQGCTPGYWKTHTAAWVGYLPGTIVSTVFDNVRPAHAGKTLLQALDGGGGPGLDGAQEILLRAAVAALLNAADPAVNYPWTEAQVLAAVHAALAQDRDTMLVLAASLDNANNLGCPKN